MPLVAVIPVNLAAGASTTVAHGLTDPKNGAAITPALVMPDRGTPITATGITSTQVTFTNTDGTNAQTANFVALFLHSIEAVAGAVNAFGWQGVPASGGASSGVIETFVYTETGVTDASAGVYADWADLMTAVVAQTTPGRKARIMLWWDVTTLPAGLWDFENVDELRGYGNSPVSNNGYPSVTLADGFRLTTLPSKISGLHLTYDNTVAAVPVCELLTFNDSSSLWLDEAVVESGSNTAQPFFKQAAVGPQQTLAVKLTGANRNLVEALVNNHGAGGELFEVTINGSNLFFDIYSDRGMSENIAKTANAASTLRIWWNNTTTQDPKYRADLTTYFSTWGGILTASQAFAAPGFTTAGAPAVSTPVASTANAGFTGAWVWGDLNLEATAGNSATINWQVESGFGTGVYTTRLTASIPAGVLGAHKIPFMFFAPAGRRWQWTRGGLAGTTETLGNYIVSAE